MSAHTPGPWTCFFKQKYDEWHVSIPMAEDSTMRWAMFDDGIRTENPEADARLIAAAPDLLCALVNLLDAIGGAHSTDIWCTDAQEAIAKATGVSS